MKRRHVNTAVLSSCTASSPSCDVLVLLHLPPNLSSNLIQQFNLLQACGRFRASQGAVQGEDLPALSGHGSQVRHHDRTQTLPQAQAQHTQQVSSAREWFGIDTDCVQVFTCWCLERTTNASDTHLRRNRFPCLPACRPAGLPACA